MAVFVQLWGSKSLLENPPKCVRFVELIYWTLHPPAAVYHLRYIYNTVTSNKTNRMAEPTTSPSEKPQMEHLEGNRADVDDMIKVDGYDSYGLVKSRYDELSIFRTLWVFKRVILVSLAVYTGYICEGFEVSECLLSSRYTRWCAVLVIPRGLYGIARCWRQCYRECWLHQAIW